MTRTFVLHRDDRVVVAYYSLAAHPLQREELPAAVARGGPRQIPAILLARLALDESLQGQGIGGAVLAEALPAGACRYRDGWGAVRRGRRDR